MLDCGGQGVEKGEWLGQKELQESQLSVVRSDRLNKDFGTLDFSLFFSLDFMPRPVLFCADLRIFFSSLHFPVPSPMVLNL